MRAETTPERATPGVLQHPLALLETIEPDISRCESLAMSSDPAAEHDSSLLVAALEDLEAQRAAIEWLLDAQLLHLCLV
jgi:hypothetical protein